MLRALSAVALLAPALTLGLLQAAAANAGTEVGPGPLPGVHALTGARIVVAPGREIEAGTLIIRDGVIAAVGADIEPPPDARLWDLAGMTLYPGLIEPYAPRSLPAPGKEEVAPRAGDPNPMVRPEREMALYGLDAPAVERLREAGFTTAAAAPADGLFRGASAVLNLGDGPLGENLLERRLAQHVAFKPAADAYPESLMGSVALFRQVILDARWQAAATDAYDRRPGQERPPYSTALAALAAAASGEERLIIETADSHDSLRAIALARELDVEVAVVGNGHEYERLEEVAAGGLPHLVPLAFPPVPEVDDEDDLTIDLARLRHWDRAPDNPRLLLEAGVTVAFTTHGLDSPSDAHARVAEAIERGLAREAALAAWTVTPAELFGIADRAGTLEVGKMANMAVVEGDLFVEKPKIREVWIDGRRLELDPTEPPEVEPAGTWELSAETEGGEVAVRLELEGVATELGGTVTVMGSVIPLSSATVSGSTVELEFPGGTIGMPGTITMSLQIRGERARGSGGSPEGPFTLRGSRTVKPDGGGRRR